MASFPKRLDAPSDGATHLIKVIAFDLDDTLLDTTRLLLPVAYTEEYFKRISDPLPLMKGAFTNLKKLGQKYILVLVTQGVGEIQNKKIDAMGIRNTFQKIYITNEKGTQAKLALFQQVCSDFALGSSEFISVGNRRTTDIRNAKKAGGLTCLFRYGEHLDESITEPEDKADFEITHHHELIATCQL